MTKLKSRNFNGSLARVRCLGLVIRETSQFCSAGPDLGPTGLCFLICTKAGVGAKDGISCIKQESLRKLLRSLDPNPFSQAYI